MKKIPRSEITNHILRIVDSKDNDKELFIDSYELANHLGVSQDKVRNALSGLRKILITFIPVKKKGQKGIYVLYDGQIPTHQKLLEQYVRYNINQVKTMYFNDIVKYLPIIKDEKLKNEIGQMYLTFDGENNGKAND